MIIWLLMSVKLLILSILLPLHCHGFFLSRAVDGVDLFVCGDFVYNHFHDCRDVGRLLCVDRISDILCLPSSQVGEVTPVLSCEDGVLRTVKVCSSFCFFFTC